METGTFLNVRNCLVTNFTYVDMTMQALSYVPSMPPFLSSICNGLNAICKHESAWALGLWGGVLNKNAKLEISKLHKNFLWYPDQGQWKNMFSNWNECTNGCKMKFTIHINMQIMVASSHLECTIQNMKMMLKWNATNYGNMNDIVKKNANYKKIGMKWYSPLMTSGGIGIPSFSWTIAQWLTCLDWLES